MSGRRGGRRSMFAGRGRGMGMAAWGSSPEQEFILDFEEIDEEDDPPVPEQAVLSEKEKEIELLRAQIAAATQQHGSGGGQAAVSNGTPPVSEGQVNTAGAAAANRAIQQSKTVRTRSVAAGSAGAGAGVTTRAKSTVGAGAVDQPAAAAPSIASQLLHGAAVLGISQPRSPTGTGQAARKVGAGRGSARQLLEQATRQQQRVATAMLLKETTLQQQRMATTISTATSQQAGTASGHSQQADAAVASSHASAGVKVRTTGPLASGTIATRSPPKNDEDAQVAHVKNKATAQALLQSLGMNVANIGDSSPTSPATITTSKVTAAKAGAASAARRAVGAAAMAGVAAAATAAATAAGSPSAQNAARLSAGKSTPAARKRRKSTALNLGILDQSQPAQQPVHPSHLEPVPQQEQLGPVLHAEAPAATIDIQPTDAAARSAPARAVRPFQGSLKMMQNALQDTGASPAGSSSGKPTATLGGATVGQSGAMGRPARTRAAHLSTASARNEGAPSLKAVQLPQAQVPTTSGGQQQQEQQELLDDLWSPAELEARARQEYVLIKWGICLEQQERVQQEWKEACLALQAARGVPEGSEPIPPLPGMTAHTGAARSLRPQLTQLLAAMPGGAAPSAQMAAQRPAPPALEAPPAPAAATGTARPYAQQGAVVQGKPGGDGVQPASSAVTPPVDSNTPGQEGSPDAVQSAAKNAQQLIEERRARLQRQRLQREQQIQQLTKTVPVDVLRGVQQSAAGITDESSPTAPAASKQAAEPAESAPGHMAGAHEPRRRVASAAVAGHAADESEPPGLSSEQPLAKRLRLQERAADGQQDMGDSQAPATAGIDTAAQHQLAGSKASLGVAAADGARGTDGSAGTSSAHNGQKDRSAKVGPSSRSNDAEKREGDNARRSDGAKRRGSPDKGGRRDRDDGLRGTRERERARKPPAGDDRAERSRRRSRSRSRSRSRGRVRSRSRGRANSRNDRGRSRDRSRSRGRVGRGRSRSRSRSRGGGKERRTNAAAGAGATRSASTPAQQATKVSKSQPVHRQQPVVALPPQAVATAGAAPLAVQSMVVVNDSTVNVPSTAVATAPPPQQFAAATGPDAHFMPTHAQPSQVPPPASSMPTSSLHDTSGPSGSNAAQQADQAKLRAQAELLASFILGTPATSQALASPPAPTQANPTAALLPAKAPAPASTTNAALSAPSQATPVVQQLLHLLSSGQPTANATNKPISHPPGQTVVGTQASSSMQPSAPSPAQAWPSLQADHWSQAVNDVSHMLQGPIAQPGQDFFLQPPAMAASGQAPSTVAVVAAAQENINAPASAARLQLQVAPIQVPASQVHTAGLVSPAYSPTAAQHVPRSMSFGDWPTAGSPVTPTEAQPASAPFMQTSNPPASHQESDDMELDSDHDEHASNTTASVSAVPAIPLAAIPSLSLPPHMSLMLATPTPPPGLSPSPYAVATVSNHTAGTAQQQQQPQQPQPEVPVKSSLMHEVLLSTRAQPVSGQQASPAHAAAVTLQADVGSAALSVPADAAAATAAPSAAAEVPALPVSPTAATAAAAGPALPVSLRATTAAAAAAAAGPALPVSPRAGAAAAAVPALPPAAPAAIGSASSTPTPAAATPAPARPGDAGASPVKETLFSTDLVPSLRHISEASEAGTKHARESQRSSSGQPGRRSTGSQQANSQSQPALHYSKATGDAAAVLHAAARPSLHASPGRPAGGDLQPIQGARTPSGKNSARAGVIQSMVVAEASEVIDMTLDDAADTPAALPKEDATSAAAAAVGSTLPASVQPHAGRVEQAGVVALVNDSGNRAVPAQVSVSCLHATTQKDQGQYRSPLLQFKAYRMLPAYTQLQPPHPSPTDPTVCNSMDPSWPLCHYDVRGTCLDMRHKLQHMQDADLGSVATGSDLTLRQKACKSVLDAAVGSLAVPSLVQLSLACKASPEVAGLQSRGRSAHIPRETRVRAALDDERLSTYSRAGCGSIPAGGGAGAPFSSLLLCTAAAPILIHVPMAWTAQLPRSLVQPAVTAEVGSGSAAAAPAMQLEPGKQMLPRIRVADARQNRYFTGPADEQQQAQDATEHVKQPVDKSAQVAKESSAVVRTNSVYEPLMAMHGKEPTFWVQWALEHLYYGERPHSTEDRLAALHVLQQGMHQLNVIDLSATTADDDDEPAQFFYPVDPQLLSCSPLLLLGLNLASLSQGQPPASGHSTHQALASIDEWQQQAKQVMNSGKAGPGMTHALCLALMRHSRTWQDEVQLLQSGLLACTTCLSNNNTKEQTAVARRAQDAAALDCGLDLGLRLLQLLCDAGHASLAAWWAHATLPSPKVQVLNQDQLQKAVQLAPGVVKHCLEGCKTAMQNLLVHSQHQARQHAGVWRTCCSSIAARGHVPDDVLYLLGYPQPDLALQLIEPGAVLQPIGGDTMPVVKPLLTHVDAAAAQLAGQPAASAQVVAAEQHHNQLLTSLGAKIKSCLKLPPIPAALDKDAQNAIMLAQKCTSAQAAVACEFAIRALQHQPQLPSMLLHLAGKLPAPQQPWYHASNLGWSHFALPLLATSLLESHPAATSQVWVKAVELVRRVSPAAAKELVVHGLSVHPYHRQLHMLHVELSAHSSQSSKEAEQAAKQAAHAAGLAL